MRAAVLSVVLLAGCEPDIASGSYLCGPDELCPDGYACDRVDGTCVSPASVRAFACGPMHTDTAGDDAPATAQVIGDMACVSNVYEHKSCLPEGDVGDFYTFRVASNCATARVQASIVYPFAFQRLVLQLGKVGEAPVTIDSSCKGSRSPTEADEVSCLDAPVTPGEYVLGVIADGTGNCNGECKFNRYGLAVQVTTP